MTAPNSTVDQNLLPVQAYFDVDGTFQTFIGQGKAFYATANPSQSGLNITNSTINSTTIGAITPSTGVFTNIVTTTGQILTQPTGSTDIVNLLALQSYAAGISWKQPCAVATLANITLSGLQTIDGYLTLAGDRVLVKNQSTAANNGIYLASATAWTRSLDADAWQEFVSAITFIEYGTQAGGAWFCTATPGGTLGVTALNWSQFTTSATYSAGTGLTLTGTVFSITPVGTASTYGSASAVPVFTTNASGQVTSVTNTSIAITGSQVSGNISGNSANVTGTVAVANGGTGATTLSGYLFGNGTSAVTASTTIPTTALSGTITNAQLANSTISGVALGGSLSNLTAGTNITFSSGTTYNGSAAITINANGFTQVYPSAGIANSTGTAWGTSYSTTGSGTVIALATSPTFVTPVLGTPTSGNFSTGTFTWPTFNQNTTGNAATATSATTSTNLAGGVAGAVPYQSATGTTGFTAAGTSGQILQSNGTSVPTWVTFTGGATITDDTTTNATRYPLFSSATSGTLSTVYTSSTKYKYNPLLGDLTAPQIVASNGLHENAGTINTSYTIATGNNAMSVGPITVASGQSVTVSSGQRWVVL